MSLLLAQCEWCDSTRETCPKNEETFPVWEGCEHSTSGRVLHEYYYEDLGEIHEIEYALAPGVTAT